VIDVGLIGFGFAGRTFHAPVISAVQGLCLAAILQRSGSDAAAAYPDVPIARSLETLLAMDNIRLVVIATPNMSHFELARECLLTGRDVVVDKPFTTTYQEASDLAELAKASARLLSVYQNRRWDGDFMTVQGLLRSGQLGRVVLFESRFDRFRPQVQPQAWRQRAEPGSGLLFDLGTHLIDQALLLFGVPEAISADVRREREGAVVDDAFDVTLFYPRMRAVLRAGMLVSEPEPRFVVQGTCGSYVKFGLDPQEEALKRGEKPGGDNWGVEPPDRWGTLHLANGEGPTLQLLPTPPGDYRQYYENVRDALSGKAPLAVTPAQALDVMHAIDLAQEASRTGCRVPWRA
jgi:scyllo-inositol 2-dehydrogenase (NADP+)